MKAFVTLLLTCLSVSASTITGNMQTLFGKNFSNNIVTVSSLDLPRSVGGIFYWQNPQTNYLSNGLLNVTIPISGRYNLSFQGLGTVQVIIPQDSNTYDIAQVATNLTVFTYTNVLPFISGLVKTGTNITVITNNAGTPAENITLSVPGFSALNVSNYLIINTNYSFPTPVAGQIFIVPSNYDLWLVDPNVTNRIVLGH